MKGATNADNPHSTQATNIERDVGATWRKLIEWQFDGAPNGVGPEDLTIGLPGTVEIRGAQIRCVVFAIAKDLYLDPAPCARVERPSILPKIKGNLNEPAIVVEADLSLQPNGFPAVNRLAGHGRLRDAAHDRICEQSPFGSKCRSGWLRRQIINDWGNGRRRLASGAATGKQTGEGSENCAALCRHVRNINPDADEGKLIPGMLERDFRSEESLR